MDRQQHVIVRCLGSADPNSSSPSRRCLRNGRQVRLFVVHLLPEPRPSEKRNPHNAVLGRASPHRLSALACCEPMQDVEPTNKYVGPWRACLACMHFHLVHQRPRLVANDVVRHLWRLTRLLRMAWRSRGGLHPRSIGNQQVLGGFDRIHELYLRFRRQLRARLLQRL